MRDVFGVVAHHADGAPYLVGRDEHISISHDGAWTAVALCAAPVGIDLCLRAHAERATRILRWLGIDGGVAEFAALEAALKLRRLGIERVLDRDIAIAGDLVYGLGEPIPVTLHEHPDFVVAVCG